MKKLVWFILMAMLVMPVACAAEALETRDETIMLEGMEEPITTVRFESERGYAFWYDPEIIVPRPEAEGVGMDDFSPAGATDSLYQVAIFYEGQLGYSLEEAAKNIEENFLLNFGNVEEIEDTGLFAYPYRAFCSFSEDREITNVEYVVDEGEGAFHICVSYPSEAAEGFGSRVDWMLRSFEMTGRARNLLEHDGS